MKAIQRAQSESEDQSVLAPVRVAMSKTAQKSVDGNRRTPRNASEDNDAFHKSAYTLPQNIRTAHGSPKKNIRTETHCFCYPMVHHVSLLHRTSACNSISHFISMGTHGAEKHKYAEDLPETAYAPPHLIPSSAIERHSDGGGQPWRP